MDVHIESFESYILDWKKIILFVLLNVLVFKLKVSVVDFFSNTTQRKFDEYLL